jgi:anti-anti-sigma regulatory factor
VSSAKSAAAAQKPNRKRADGLFKLPPECLVSDAEALKADLARIVARTDPVTLDLEQLQRIDTAALQVITSFVRERDKDGHSTVWVGNAQALVSAAKLLGLSEILRLPAATGPAEANS